MSLVFVIWQLFDRKMMVWDRNIIYLDECGELFNMGSGVGTPMASLARCRYCFSELHSSKFFTFLHSSGGTIALAVSKPVSLRNETVFLSTKFSQHLRNLAKQTRNFFETERKKMLSVVGQK